MITVRISLEKGGSVSGDVDVILATKIYDNGKYEGSDKMNVNSFGEAIFFKDQPNREYDDDFIVIVQVQDNQTFYRHVIGRKPIVEVEIKR